MFVLVDRCRSKWFLHIFNWTRRNLRPQLKNSLSHLPVRPFTSPRIMHYGLPVMDQHSWSGIPDLPFVFPTVPTISDCSHGPPQILHGLYGPTSIAFDKSQPEEPQDFYASPCTAVADLPGCEDSWDEFIPSQLY